jgi:HAD superfamily hydrolase (TIGR01509 family)
VPRPNGRPSLILDLGGVIVDHDNAKCFARLIDLLEERPTPDELAAFIAASGVGDGSLSAEGLFDQMSARYGSTAGQRSFLAAWTCHFSLKADVYDLLTKLKAKRPFVLCSNTNAAHWDYLNHRYQLDRLADAAILSHECGYEKPMPEIYLLAAQAHGRQPGQCLFVDDRAENIEAAQALGFRTHLFTGFDAFRRVVVD